MIQTAQSAWPGCQLGRRSALGFEVRGGQTGSTQPYTAVEEGEILFDRIIGFGLTITTRMERAFSLDMKQFVRCQIPVIGTFPRITIPGRNRVIFMNVTKHIAPKAPVETSTAYCKRQRPTWRSKAIGCVVAAGLARAALSSENVPHRPFAEWAEVPNQGQFVAGLVYEESEAYDIWAAGQHHDVTFKADGEHYGIDINQGYIALQYGITARWAVDLNVGATTVGWRSFDHGVIQSTTGLMDVSFGVRYQILQEQLSESACIPTLTARVGAVVPGTYSENIAFSPGLRSAAIEPELLARKHFGWPGLGAYGDGLFRWNRTTENNQYIMSAGLFQQIQRWEIDLGFRHLQTLSGSDIIWVGDGSIIYPRDPRENCDEVEAGFSYSTAKRQIRYGFHTRAVVDGNNIDSKFWIGGAVDFPFGGKQESK